MRDAIDVDPPGRDIGGYQNTDGAGFEIFKRFEPLALRAIRVQGSRRDAFGFQAAGDPVGPVFHARKDQHHVQFRVAQKVQQQRWLQVLGNFVDELGDGLGRIRASTDLNRLGSMLKLMREALDFR